MKLKDLFKPKIIEKIIYKEPEVRDGWFVADCGQNPLCCYWYCVLCSFNLKDKEGKSIVVGVEECETFTEALNAANKKAEEADNDSKN